MYIRFQLGRESVTLNADAVESVTAVEDAIEIALRGYKTESKRARNERMLAGTPGLYVVACESEAVAKREYNAFHRALEQGVASFRVIATETTPQPGFDPDSKIQFEGADMLRPRVKKRVVQS